MSVKEMSGRMVYCVMAVGRLAVAMSCLTAYNTVLPRGAAKFFICRLAFIGLYYYFVNFQFSPIPLKHDYIPILKAVDL